EDSMPAEWLKHTAVFNRHLVPRQFLDDVFREPRRGAVNAKFLASRLADKCALVDERQVGCGQVLKMKRLRNTPPGLGQNLVLQKRPRQLRKQTGTRVRFRLPKNVKR